MASARARRLVLFALAGAALAARGAVLDFVTDDVRLWVLPWYEYILREGFRALGQEIPNASGYDKLRGNYTPPYHYLLYLATWFEGAAPRLHLVKAVSVLFDLVAAGFMYTLAGRFGARPHDRWIGGLGVLLAPTVIANGALWGQCDVIVASLLLGAVYGSMTHRPSAAMMLFGVALSFKATAIFLAPYLLMLALCSWLPWRSFWLVPAAYTAMMAPAALLGRPWTDLFLVYRDQAGFFDQLSMNAPNLYHFVPNRYYRELVLAGTGATVLASLAFAFAARRAQVAPTPRFLLLAATTSVALAPFLLPKMHDRYFFTADIVSIALGIVDRRLWFVPVLFQCSSLIAYVPIITDSLNNFEGEFTALNPLAVAINSVLVAYLLTSYGRALAASWRARPGPGSPSGRSS
jgi:Gpi18-like mannosyltransferase